MHDWNYSPDHPITLTLAADARLDPTDYTNDQIWELVLGSSEPPAISLQTTFGLRARFCRIFPRFILNGQVVNDPVHFHHPITIHQFYPNYIKLSFKPYSSINAILEYWVPNSHAVSAKMKVSNTSHETVKIEVEWSELLAPAPDGERMSPKENGLATILAGQTTNLAPVLFLTGGAQPGKSSYPSLRLSYTMPAHSEQENRWAHASLTDVSASFDLAKELINKNWDNEIARIIRINSQRMEISTGNHDWNNAFYMSQTLADQLFIQPKNSSKATSFVGSRHPDQGYSILGDGSDYTFHWSGQTALDTYYLTNFLLPSAPGVLKGLLDNFIDTQSAQGEIDLKPGLGGQRRNLLSVPLLATIASLLNKYSTDREYIKAIFPKLLSFFFSWFTHRHDRDDDSYPEWDQVIQTGFEEHPLFSYSDSLAGGVDISSVECPDLAAYLFKECQSLMSLAHLLGKSDTLRRLESTSDKLQTMIESTWSDPQACFQYRDRDTHISSPLIILGKQTGPGILEIHQQFQQPVRPMIYIESSREGTRPVQIYIHGTTSADAHRVDRIPTHQIHWHLSKGYITSEFIYQIIEQVEISGILPDDQIIVQTANLVFIDQTTLLPLWAGIPSIDKAKILINLSIMNKKSFLCSYGLRSWINIPETNRGQAECSSIHPFWMSFILEGMVHYGESKKAAELFTRIMKAVVSSLKKDMTFHLYYDADTGKPGGIRNSLASLVPIGSFLKILGIDIINPSKVEIIGSNPFPWPVTIQYRGITVIQQEKKTMVIFSDGQSITVDNNRPQIISAES